jgi:hypothetical protein
LSGPCHDPWASSDPPDPLSPDRHILRKGGQADHLAALGWAVGEVARAFGGRAWTVADARQKHRAADTRWTEEDEVRLASEAARGRTVEELAHLFGRKPSAIQSRLRHLKLRH